jgi:hypothetical protein
VEGKAETCTRRQSVLDGNKTKKSYHHKLLTHNPTTPTNTSKLTALTATRSQKIRRGRFMSWIISCRCAIHNHDLMAIRTRTLMAANLDSLKISGD